MPTLKEQSSSCGEWQVPSRGGRTSCRLLSPPSFHLCKGKGWQLEGSLCVYKRGFQGLRSGNLTGKWLHNPEWTAQVVIQAFCCTMVLGRWCSLELTTVQLFSLVHEVTSLLARPCFPSVSAAPAPGHTWGLFVCCFAKAGANTWWGGSSQGPKSL